tara:strand:+ start:367 stop:489 length:123 start_codon:yes stop_codon:yes gene_type:complete
MKSNKQDEILKTLKDIYSLLEKLVKTVENDDKEKSKLLKG